MERGHAGNEGELFIERGVGLVKAKVRGTPTSNPAYSLAKTAALRTGLMQFGSSLKEEDMPGILP